MSQKMILQCGDTVRIKCQGFTQTGTVISADNYGTDEQPDWYIEYNHSNNGYAYWKQGLDGGTVTKLEIEETT